MNTSIQWKKKENRQIETKANQGAEVDLQDRDYHADNKIAWIYEQIGKLNPIDRSIALMLLDGLRSREVLDLQLESLQLADAQIRVLGKGSKHRLLPVPAETVEALQSYLRLERPLTNSPFLFVSLKGPRRGQPLTPAGLRSLFRHHRLCSQVSCANPHRLRHTFGADMVRGGISLPALQHLMGHSHIRTTMLYVQLAPQDVWREYARAVQNRTRLPFPKNL